MKAIIWDLDNTIYQNPDDFYKNCYDQAATIAVQHGYPESHAHALEASHESFKKYGYSIESFFHEHGIERTLIEPLYVGYVADLLSPCTATRRYIESFTGPQMVMSHSNRAWVDAVMTKLALDDLIPHSHRLASDDIGYEGKKLSSEPFLRAATLLQHDPKDIAVFEDSIDNLAYAKNIGMTTILVTNGTDIPKLDFVDHVISRPHDIDGLLKAK